MPKFRKTRRKTRKRKKGGESMTGAVSAIEGATMAHNRLMEKKSTSRDQPATLEDSMEMWRKQRDNKNMSSRLRSKSPVKSRDVMAAEWAKKKKKLEAMNVSEEDESAEEAKERRKTLAALYPPEGGRGRKTKRKGGRKNKSRRRMRGGRRKSRRKKGKSKRRRRSSALVGAAF